MGRKTLPDLGVVRYPNSMRHLIVALLYAVTAASAHARMDFEKELKEISGEIGDMTAATRKVHKVYVEALREADTTSDEIGGEKQETAKLPPKDGAAPAIKIAVFARTEEKADLIRKLLEAKYCPTVKSCKKTQVSVMGNNPADRSLFDRLVTVYKNRVDVVGMDAGMYVGSGASVKLKQIRKAGAIVHGIAFAERNSLESPDDHSDTIELCDAGKGGPGCGGD